MHYGNSLVQDSPSIYQHGVAGQQTQSVLRPVDAISIFRPHRDSYQPVARCFGLVGGEYEEQSLRVYFLTKPLSRPNGRSRARGPTKACE